MENFKQKTLGHCPKSINLHGHGWKFMAIMEQWKCEDAENDCFCWRTRKRLNKLETFRLKSSRSSNNEIAHKWWQCLSCWWEQQSKYTLLLICQRWKNSSKAYWDLPCFTGSYLAILGLIWGSRLLGPFGAFVFFDASWHADISNVMCQSDLWLLWCLMILGTSVVLNHSI